FFRRTRPGAARQHHSAYNIAATRRDRRTLEAGTSDSGQSGRHHHRTFAPRRAALSDVTGFVADVCDAARPGREPSLRLRLLTESLFTNPLNHGYRGDSEGPWRSRFEGAEG